MGSAYTVGSAGSKLQVSPPRASSAAAALTWRVDDGAASTMLQMRGMTTLAQRESPSSTDCMAARSTCTHSTAVTSSLPKVRGQAGPVPLGCHTGGCWASQSTGEPP